MVRKYKIYGGGNEWFVTGNDKQDAIYELHKTTGMPIDFIKKTFYIKRVY